MSIAGAVVVGGANLIGSLIQSGAATRAANAANAASLEALALQIDHSTQLYNHQLELMKPLLATQYGANDAFQRMMGIQGTLNLPQFQFNPRNEPGDPAVGGNGRLDVVRDVPGDGGTLDQIRDDVSGRPPDYDFIRRQASGLRAAPPEVDPGGGRLSRLAAQAAGNAGTQRVDPRTGGYVEAGDYFRNPQDRPVDVPDSMRRGDPRFNGGGAVDRNPARPVVDSTTWERIQQYGGGPGRQGGVSGGPQLGAPGADFGFQPQPYSVGFQDPNVSTQRLGRGRAVETELGAHVFNNQIAGDDPSADLAIRRAADTALYSGVDNDTMVQQVRENQLAGGSLGEDAIVQDIRSRRTVGDSFEESPGFAFQMEQMQRALERSQSRGGGGLGGAAAQEMQRRAQGLASQDYWRWQQAASAENQRFDQAAYNFADRQRFDIGRGDLAVADARRREEMDIQRGDTASYDYLRRRAEQFGQERNAILNNQQLQLGDRQRDDQNYINYMNRLMAASGLGGNTAGQVANLAGTGGANVGSAYAAYGNNVAANAGNSALAQGAIWGNFANNLGGVVGNAYQDYMTQQNLAGGANPPQGIYLDTPTI